jgi:hypothetical protein
MIVLDENMGRVHLMQRGLAAYRLNEEEIFLSWTVRGRRS